MKHATPHRLVLLQGITGRWHKASRGAPGAVARNRVPEALALPANLPDTPWPSRFQHAAPQLLPSPDPPDNRAADIFLHLVAYGEDDQFQAPRAQYWVALRSRLPEPSTLHLPHSNVPPFTLTGVDDTLQVQFEWSREVGVPPRNYRHRREQAALGPGQWMQVRYNGRHVYSEDGTWYYEKHAVNIGFSDTFNPTVFVAAPPTYQVSDFADLHESLTITARRSRLQLA